MAAEHTLEYGELSDVGRRRASNQDSKAVLQPWSGEQFRRRGWLFLVADGMGAHAAGEMASDLASRLVPLAYERTAARSPPLALRTSIEQANAEIYARGSTADDLRGMGTTCTVLALVPRGALVGHVGDSRCYRVRGDRIDQLSRDHSLAWDVEAQGPPGMEDAIPKNIITRSMGPHPEVKVDVEGPLPVEEGDVFVLCSDGLSGQVADEEIGLLAARLPPKEATEALVGLALVRGAPDNVTVIVARAGAREASQVSREDAPWPLTETTSDPPRRRRPPVRSLLAAAAGLLLGLVASSFTGLAGEEPSEMVRAIAMVVSLAGLMVFVGGVAAALLSMIDRGGDPAEVLEVGRRIGKGPYRTYACGISEPLVDGIAASVEAAADGLPDPTRERLLEAVAAARTAARGGDFSKAITATATAIADYRRAVEAARQDDTACG